MQRPPALFLLATLVLAAGCREAKVESYRVPKEQPEPLPPILTGEMPSGPAAGGSMANTAVPTASGDDLTWHAPDHWKAKATGAMRKGSFTVPGDNGADADLSITAFPGDVGGLLANVNRWRGQIDLPPIAETDLAGAITHVEQNGLVFVIVDFANPNASKSQRILGALVPYNGATWFFKLMGPDATVGHEKPAFLAFLKTVQPPGPATKERATQ